MSEIDNDQKLILKTLIGNLDIKQNEIQQLINILASPKDISNHNVKHIFKILINYTYKLREKEIQMNEDYQQNFKQINAAIDEIKKEMKKIIKEPSSTETKEEAQT